MLVESVNLEKDKDQLHIFKLVEKEWFINSGNQIL